MDHILTLRRVSQTNILSESTTTSHFLQGREMAK